MHHKTAFLIVILTLFCSSPAFAQSWAADMFAETSHDFGSVARGAKAQFEFPLENLYLEDVHISSVSSSCGCTQAEIQKPTLKTYEKGAIVATINTKAFEGSKGATITVNIDKPRPATVQLHSKVYIRSDVVFEPGSVSFGDLDKGEAADRKVLVRYAGRDDWKIKQVSSDNPHIHATAKEIRSGGGTVEYELDVKLDKDAPVGYINDHLVLETNDYRLKQVPLEVDGRVLSGITVSPSSLFMGVMKPGDTIKKKLVIRGKKPFRIKAIEADGGAFSFDTSKDKEAKKTHVIPITFLAGKDSGKITHKISIETDLGDTKSDLSAFAVVANGNGTAH